MPIILFQSPKEIPNETIIFDKSRILFLNIKESTFDGVSLDRLSPRNIQNNEPLETVEDFIASNAPDLIVFFEKEHSSFNEFTATNFFDVLNALDPKSLEFSSLEDTWIDQMESNQVKEVSTQYPSLFRGASNNDASKMVFLTLAKLKRKLQPVVVR